MYRLSALDIGAAVAGVAGLLRPGTRNELAIPGFLSNFTGGDTKFGSASAAAAFADEEDYKFSIRHTVPAHTKAVRVDFDDVLLLGTVQSRCDPLRMRAWSS